MNFYRNHNNYLHLIKSVSVNSTGLNDVQSINMVISNQDVLNGGGANWDPTHDYVLMIGGNLKDTNNIPGSVVDGMLAFWDFEMYYRYLVPVEEAFVESNTFSYQPSYRFGFQGQERDDEIKGIGNSWNYKYRMHDPRLGRFFAVDPMTRKYPFYSPYAFSGNRVIDAIEQEGLQPEQFINYFKNDGVTQLVMQASTDILDYLEDVGNSISKTFNELTSDGDYVNNPYAIDGIEITSNKYFDLPGNTSDKRGTAELPVRSVNLDEMQGDMRGGGKLSGTTEAFFDGVKLGKDLAGRTAVEIDKVLYDENKQPIHVIKLKEQQPETTNVSKDRVELLERKGTKIEKR